MCKVVKKCSEKFQYDALKLAFEIGVWEASEKLNIFLKTLYRWQRLDRLNCRHVQISARNPEADLHN